MSLFTLIRNGQVYAPEPLGRRDILLACGRIALVADRIEPPDGFSADVVDWDGKPVAPGMIDLHVHITGGGGEGGPATRVPEIQLSRITTAGVTTVLGVLGTDDVTRHPETLLAKVHGLEQEGITAFMTTGSYRFPDPVTITGSVRRDIALIPHVVGVGEIALADHRSAQPTFEDLAKLAAEARVGGMLGKKPGLVVVHMGEGRRRMEDLFRLIEKTEIPVSQLLPTHVTRTRSLFQHAIRFGQSGGNLDITVGDGGKEAPAAADALRRLTAAGVGTSQITLSSDANGSLPRFDDKGCLIGLEAASISHLTREVGHLIAEEGFPPGEVLGWVTRNAAERLGVQARKGRICAGLDADLVLFDTRWQVDRVYAAGRLMVAGGEAVIRGMFE